MSLDWHTYLAEQLDWHWQYQLRPRLDGLTDDEYFWEPVPGCWSVRKRADSDASLAQGRGDYVFEQRWPEPTPPPVTTIAWRLGHLIVGVLGERVAAHFDGPPCAADSFEYAGTAEDALRQLDETYARWAAGVGALGSDGMTRPCGPAEGPFAAYPLAALVVHINREMIHHGAEICLLRDLYRGGVVVG
jgi:hypothetical protein